MINHRFVLMTLVLSCLAACNGWFQPCTYPGEPYCIESNGTDDGGCDGGQKYYVWFLDDQCGAASTSFCSDAANAQAHADELLGATPHGTVSTDPNATMPTEVSFCPTGTCVVGSSDGSLMRSFSVFDKDTQIPLCESLVDPGGACSWPPTDTTCGGSL